MMKWLISIFLLLLFLVPGRFDRHPTPAPQNHFSYNQKKLYNRPAKANIIHVHHTPTKPDATASPGRKKQVDDGKAASIEEDDEEESGLLKKQQKFISSGFVSYYYQTLAQLYHCANKSVLQYQRFACSASDRYIMLRVIRI